MPPPQALGDNANLVYANSGATVSVSTNTAEAPLWQLAPTLGGLQYLATAFDSDGNVVATAQCAIKSGANTPPWIVAPLRLYLYSGVPFNYSLSTRVWMTDDYTSPSDLAVAISSACRWMVVGDTCAGLRCALAHRSVVDAC